MIQIYREKNLAFTFIYTQNAKQRPESWWRKKKGISDQLKIAENVENYKFIVEIITVARPPNR